MEEILEQIKKLSRNEQLELAEKIYALGPGGGVVDAQYINEIERQTDEASRVQNLGTSWDEIAVQMLKEQGR